MKNVSVLHCITGLNIGGAELMLARFLGASNRAKYPATVLSLMKPGAAEKHYAGLGLEIKSINMAESRLRLADFAGLWRIATQHRPKLFHGWMYHGNIAASCAAIASLRFQPVIWSIHHSVVDMAAEKPMTRKIIRLSAKLSRRTAAISYCSRISADQHEALGFDPTKRRVIPNGIDCDVFSPAADARPRLRRLMGVPLDRFVIGNVARFHPMKDQAGLVRAVAGLLRQGYDVQGLIVGAGHDDEGPVRRTARDLGISDRITTLGARDDVANLLPGLDIYALSSAWGEAFPLAATEAMACGVPVATTDVGDCAWLVGDTGAIVPPSDHAAMTSALARLLALSSEARFQLGGKARQRVEEKFSLHQYVSQHEALYCEVLENCRS